MSFQRILVLDWETSGLPSETNLPRYDCGPQGIELGAVVVDSEKWTVLSDFSSRVRFLSGMHWSETAERIHGISQTEASSAPSPQAVFGMFDSFLEEWFDRDIPILIAGQNPAFDRWFTHQLFWLAGFKTTFPWRFHSRMLDTFSLGYLQWDATTGNDLYQRVCGVQRQRHSAHQDACLGATVICKAFQLNSSLSEDNHDTVSDREIHRQASDGDPNSASPVWSGDHCSGRADSSSR